MTHSQFVRLAGDFAKYANKEVTYKHYSPSAKQMVQSSGILLGIGIDSPQSDTIIMGDKGHRVQMYYTYVDFPKK